MTWKQATLRGLEWGAVLGAFICLMANNGEAAFANVAMAAYFRWVRQ